MSKSETNSKETNTFSIEEVCKSSNLLKNLHDVIDSHPEEIAKALVMSIIHLLNNEHCKMIECLKFLVNNYPELGSIHRRIAETYISQGNFEAATPYLEKALKLDNEDITARIWLGLSYYKTGNEKKAETCLSLLKDDVFLIHAANNNWL